MQKKYHCRFCLLFLILTLMFSCKTGNKKDYQYFHNKGGIFATSYSIKYAYERSLEQEIINELHKFDLSMNPFNEKSIISKVNRNEPVALDSFFLNVFRRSEEVSQATDGSFDITISPLINAWGFGFQHMDSVTPEMIDSLKEFVGYKKISIDAQQKISKTDPRIQINTSAIAKGYACDVIANLLKSYGIENYMVEIGGEVAAKGLNDKGVCWRIEITKPVDDSTGIIHHRQAVISLCDKSLATSGNYRNYYIKNGKKYAHTIDPITGYPTQLDILGATVIADDCMTADAYATAFMVMGLEKSIEKAKEIVGLHYYFVYEKPDESLGVIYSDDFEQFIISNNDASATNK